MKHDTARSGNAQPSPPDDDTFVPPPSTVMTSFIASTASRFAEPLRQLA
jgi:hypothetical protein